MKKPSICSRYPYRELFALAAMVLSSIVIADSEPTVSEIIVTAENRESDLLDVPISINLLNDESLNLSKVDEFIDLVQLSPSLTFEQNGDRRGAGILIRGLGTTAYQTAVEPTVGTVVDDVNLGRTNQFLTDLDDIERIEILRGPQGTLFGKNSSAGLIHIITKSPTEEYQASLRGSITNDGGWTSNAMISGPITQQALGRLSLFKKNFDGIGKNLFSGNDINGDDSEGLRGKLDIALTETINLYLIADYSRQDRNCCNPFFEDVGGNPFYLYDYAQFGIKLDERNDKTLDAQDGFANTKTWGISSNLSVEFDKWVLRSITAFRSFNLTHSQGADGVPYQGGPVAGRIIVDKNGAFAGGDQSQRQFSQEIRLQSTGYDRFDLTSGLYFWQQTVDRFFIRDLYTCSGASVDPANPQNTACTSTAARALGSFNSTAETTSYSAYGQLDYHINQRLTSSFGLRYTLDDIDVEMERISPFPGLAVAPSTGLIGNSLRQNNLSGKLAVSYDINDDIMTYFSYTQGYKSPAFDLIFNSTQERLDRPVPAEESQSYEIGMKGKFLDNRLALTLTGFYTTIDGLQGQAYDTNALAFFLTSAGKAVTRGIELDFIYLPTHNLRINGAAAYTDAFYDDYRNAPCFFGQTAAQGCNGQVQDISGRQIANAPRLKYTLQTRYDIPLPTSFNLFLAAGYRWEDDSPGNQDQDPRLKRDSYGVLDLTFGVESNNRRWNAQFFVKNAFDDYYIDKKSLYGLTAIAPFNGGVGGPTIQHYLTRDAQRYIGLEFEYRFGSW